MCPEALGMISRETEKQILGAIVDSTLSKWTEEKP